MSTNDVVSVPVREREPTRSKDTESYECTCHFLFHILDDFFRSFFQIQQMVQVGRIVWGAVPLTMSWKGFIWVVELFEGLPV